MSLADFTILNKIGQGSYSSVHKVKRISDGKQYALKKVRMMTLKEKQKQNSLNQVRILASINSQYIISYKDAFIDEASNSLCLIMEYANGGDLQKKIEGLSKKITYFQQVQIWKLANNILNGLRLLHQMKILHRDLKSANIFICDGVYKLGDLNVSKILKKGLAYTQTGTPYYASPQVWRDEPYDSKSDIWSLGCVLYQACALRPPFHAKNMEGLYKKVQKGIFDRIPARYSEQLQKIIEQCIQLNYFKRPSCQQLLNQRKFLQMSNLNIVPMSHSLIDTIKIPRNLINLKQMLPKNKYQLTDINSKYQRVPSRKSQAHYLRDRNLSIKNILKKNASQRGIFPEIKKNIQLIKPSNEYYVFNLENQNIADNKIKQKKERQKKLFEDQKQLRDKLEKERVQSKQSERLKQKISLKQRNLIGVKLVENNRNLINIPQLPKKEVVKLPSLSPPALNQNSNSYIGKEDKGHPYQYFRPSWWG